MSKFVQILYISKCLLDTAHVTLSHTQIFWFSWDTVGHNMSYIHIICTVPLLTLLNLPILNIIFNFDRVFLWYLPLLQLDNMVESSPITCAADRKLILFPRNVCQIECDIWSDLYMCTHLCKVNICNVHTSLLWTDDFYTRLRCRHVQSIYLSAKFVYMVYRSLLWNI